MSAVPKLLLSKVVEAWEAGLHAVAIPTRCVARLADLAHATREPAGADDVLIAHHVRRVLLTLAGTCPAAARLVLILAVLRKIRRSVLRLHACHMGVGAA